MWLCPVRLAAIVQPPPQLVALMSIGRFIGLVATVSQYFVAPSTALQLSVTVEETPTAPSAGLKRTGAPRRLLGSNGLSHVRSPHDIDVAIKSGRSSDIALDRKSRLFRKAPAREDRRNAPCSLLRTREHRDQSGQLYPT